MGSLHQILPCRFVACLLEALTKHYADRACELVLVPHTDEAHDYAYAAVMTSESLDLVRAPITDADPTFDVVSMPPFLLVGDLHDSGVTPLALVHDAISEGAWG